MILQNTKINTPIKKNLNPFPLEFFSIEDRYLMDFIKILYFRSAPNTFFNNPVPQKNPFEVGQVLESIDPRNSTFFCVVVVVKVQGT